MFKAGKYSDVDNSKDNGLIINLMVWDGKKYFKF